MEVKKFNFEFEHMAFKVAASCDVFQPESVNYPMYLVAVKQKSRVDADIYICYKVDWPGKAFEWFALPGMKQFVAKALIKYTAAEITGLSITGP